MNKNYAEIYAAKMSKMQKSNISAEILEELEMSNISSQRADSLMAEMSKVTGRPVFSDFNFRTGNIMGILRHIMQNRKVQDELFRITNLTNAHIDFWFKNGGNLPYCDPKTNVVVAGRNMNCEKIRQFIPVVAGILGILINPEDLDDINTDRWEQLYKRAMENAQETADLNIQNGTVAYEE